MCNVYINVSWCDLASVWCFCWLTICLTRCIRHISNLFWFFLLLILSCKISYLKIAATLMRFVPIAVLVLGTFHSNERTKGVRIWVGRIHPIISHILGTDFYKMSGWRLYFQIGWNIEGEMDYWHWIICEVVSSPNNEDALQCLFLVSVPCSMIPCNP